jgi:hypothetical protein
VAAKDAADEMDSGAGANLVTKLDIQQLKHEAAFVADDPWHETRHDTFSLDYYFCAGGGRRHGIRAELSGVQHDLPDSLYYAWKAGSIKAESLPRLLHAMEPMLKSGKDGDFGIQWSNKTFTVAVWIAGIWLALAIVACIGFAVMLGGLPVGIPSAVLLVLLGPRVFYRAIYVVWRRRMDQTKWILAQPG